MRRKSFAVSAAPMSMCLAAAMTAVSLSTVLTGGEAGGDVNPQVSFSLKKVPFSSKGAVFSVTDHAQNRGLTIQDVSGKGNWGENKFLLLRLLDGSKLVQPEAAGSECLLKLSVNRDMKAEIAFADANALRIRGKGMPLVLQKGDKRSVIKVLSEEKAELHRNFSYGSSDYILRPLRGRLAAYQNGIAVYPDGSGNYEVVLESVDKNAPERTGKDIPFDECVRNAQSDFDNWLSRTPSVPDAYSDARKQAAYVLWSSVLAPGGHLKRPGMLMSKNWMIYIWSWDHCFNAISCSYGMPDTAWDQFMIFADHQLPSGQIPDLIGRGRKDIGLIKPPIHGWTLRKIRDNNKLSIEQIGQAYAMLARKTDYMTKDRASVNGLPAINDAMDSGWDNMSECTMNNKKPGKVNYENAGHCSYLILMMDELNELALMLGKKDEAAAWKSRSADLYEKMIARLWTGERFVMRRSDTGDAKMNSQSLNRFMPLILGEKLRQDIRDKMIKDLKTCGNITKWGAATEAPSSPHYKANGYWLGPIWAPPTLFLVDGLDRCGEKALAKDLARLFCDMCAKNGFAENFDAETGAGLRDLAYTWTASTFLILAHEYLQ